MLSRALNTYILIARILPAGVTLVPFFIFWYYYSQIEELKPLVDFIIGINFLTISISMLLLYVYVQTIRQIAKIFEELYSSAKDDFPTTYLMMYSNSYFSKAYKKNIVNM